MKSHTRPSDREDSFSDHIDQRDPQAAEAELEYAARYQQDVADDNPHDFAEREQGCQFVRTALKSLTAREQDFVKKCFGIDCQCMSKEDIGKSNGISGTRVGAIIAKALRKLRHPRRSDPLRGLLDELEVDRPPSEATSEVKKANVAGPNPIFGPNPEQYLVSRGYYGVSTKWP